MLVERNPEGAWVISDTIGGYSNTRLYYFYTKREAVELFRREFHTTRQG